jgi:type IV pilus assembly protein PilM
MFGFVSNMLAARANPIGIDFGTDTLRLVQVSTSSSETRVVAAASVDVPGHIRNDAQQRLTFFGNSLRELLATGGFKGRQAVMGLPSSVLHLLHMRLPIMDSATLVKALPQEARGKLPFDPSHAIIRHIVAGEIYHGQEQKIETILMASPKSTIESLLSAAGKAKLDIVSINTEPAAMLDCMMRLGRKEDREKTICYVDIGASGSRVVVAQGTRIAFARSIPIGGDHFTRAVASAAKMSFENAKLLRLRLAELTGTQVVSSPEMAVEKPAEIVPDGQTEENSFALLGAAMAKQEKKAAATVAPAPPQPPPEAEGMRELRGVETAVRELLTRLVRELELCRRYHEATFSSMPVEKMVFLGGEARQRGLCSFVAREMGLAASMADPIARMPRSPGLDAENGLDVSKPQPGWAVALGLSMGPISVENTQPKSQRAA